MRTATVIVVTTRLRASQVYKRDGGVHRPVIGQVRIPGRLPFTCCVLRGDPSVLCIVQRAAVLWVSWVPSHSAFYRYGHCLVRTRAVLIVQRRPDLQISDSDFDVIN